MDVLRCFPIAAFLYISDELRTKYKTESSTTQFSLWILTAVIALISQVIESQETLGLIGVVSLMSVMLSSYRRSLSVAPIAPVGEPEVDAEAREATASLIALGDTSQMRKRPRMSHRSTSSVEFFNTLQRSHSRTQALVYDRWHSVGPLLEL